MLPPKREAEVIQAPHVQVKHDLVLSARISGFLRVFLPGGAAQDSDRIPPRERVALRLEAIADFKPTCLLVALPSRSERVPMHIGKISGQRISVDVVSSFGHDVQGGQIHRSLPVCVFRAQSVSRLVRGWVRPPRGICALTSGLQWAFCSV